MRGIVVCVVVAASAGAAARQAADVPLFERAAAVNVGGRSGDITLADIDRDGRLDLIAAHPPDPIISVRLGDGRGAFSPVAGVPTAIPGGAAGMVVGDLNGDDAPDLVVANRDERREYVVVLLGDGGGRFSQAAGSPYVTGSAFAFY